MPDTFMIDEKFLVYCTILRGIASSRNLMTEVVFYSEGISPDPRYFVFQGDPGTRDF